MKKTTFLTLILIVGSLPSCITAYQFSFEGNDSFKTKNFKDCDPLILGDNLSRDDYTILGTCTGYINSNDFGGDFGDAFKNLKNCACKYGGDAIFIEKSYAKKGYDIGTLRPVNKLTIVGTVIRFER